MKLKAKHIKEDIMAKKSIKTWIKEHKKQLLVTGGILIVGGVLVAIDIKTKKGLASFVKEMKDFDEKYDAALEGKIGPFTELFEDGPYVTDVTLTGMTLEEMGAVGAKLIEEFGLDPKKRSWVMVEQKK
jgi:hypothetical protein